mmetsp:Transcript_73747/g.130815  ORF Transcript_73747/g.130815 Transcript_73747/m.130815 type:complete len:430 (-) Transcript_73747:110-1399(-)
MSALYSAQTEMPTVDRAPDARFIKTKVCTFHLRRKCTRGEACKFAHDVDELTPLPDLSCTRMCKAFLRSGACINGDSCTFAHTQDELRGTGDVPPMMLQEKLEQPSKSILLKVDMCKFFRQGKCLLGTSCTFAHDESELQQRPNLHRTSACFAFWKGKCRAGDDCKYSHILEIAPKDEKAGNDDKCTHNLEISAKDEVVEVNKPGSADIDSFDDSLFARQTTCGTNFSSPSRDSLPVLWSRQTSWADLEDDDVQLMWSRQGSLEDIAEDSSVFSPHQALQKGVMWSRQTSWADLNDDDEDDFADFLWSRQTSLDTKESNEAASPLQSFNNSDGLSSQQASSVESDDEENECGVNSKTSVNGSESTDAPSSNRCDDNLSQEVADDLCARLRDVSGLHGLQVSVKNTFLAFDDHDRQVMSGTASHRARSFA